MKSTDVPATFRDMWETRPSRPRDDRMLAGVAAGIARRYDIDPVLVRVGFVVAALSGIGAVLYVAGWIALPDGDLDPAAPRRSRPKPILVIAMIAAVGIGIGGFFDNGSAVVLPLLAAAALLFLLHRSRSDNGPVAAPATDVPAAVETPTVAGPSLVKEPVAVDAPQPPAWDPLGAAPFAWDLPEPSPLAPPPAPQPRRLPVTAVTLGLAMLGGALTAAIMLLTGMLSATTFPTVLGVPLAVLGAGLVIGAFVRAGRGLVPVALLLSAFTWAVLAVPLDRIRSEGLGDLTVRPASADQVAPSYARAAGDIAIDLRGIDLSAPGAPLRTQVTSGAGDIDIWLPPNADVTFTGSSGFGSVQLDGREQQEGPGAQVRETDDLGADGVRSGRPIVIGVQAGAGDVEVHRG